MLTKSQPSGSLVLPVSVYPPAPPCCGSPVAPPCWPGSHEDLLPGLGQAQSQQPPRHQRCGGQQDGHHLGYSHEGGEDGGAKDGCKLAQAVKDSKRCGSTGRRKRVRVFITVKHLRVPIYTV